MKIQTAPFCKEAIRPQRVHGDDGRYCASTQPQTGQHSEQGRARRNEGERGTDLRTVAAAVVETVQAPPAVVFLQALQCQIPTAVRLTESCQRHHPPRVSVLRPSSRQTHSSPLFDLCRSRSSSAGLLDPLREWCARIKTNLAAEGAAENARGMSVRSRCSLAGGTLQGEHSRVGSVLGDFHLLDRLPQRSTVTLLCRMSVRSRTRSGRPRDSLRTVPYFPVTPTFLVRLVICDRAQGRRVQATEREA